MGSVNLISSRLYVISCVCLCALLSQKTAYAQSGADEKMRIYTEDIGPSSSVQNGKVVGFGVELVREILRRINHIDNIQVVPWARGYALLQTQANMVLFSMIRSSDREALFKWVGPIYTNNWVMYKRKDSHLKVATLNDAKKVHYIGVYRDDAKYQFLLNEGFTNVAPVSIDRQNLLKLRFKRIDLWMSTNTSFYGETANDELVASEFEEAFVVKKNSLYIAMSVRTPIEVVQKWQDALDAMKKDGTYKRIMSSHPVGAMTMTFEPPRAAVASARK